MSRTTVRSDFHVQVFPRDAGDFGVAHLSGQHHTEEAEESLCREIAQDVERHVDNLPSIGAKTRVVWESRDECEYCGSIWTEGDLPHNGGCCHEDCLVLESTPEEEATA